MKRGARTPRNSHAEEIVTPIILAAGPRGRLPFPKALAPFGKRTALERAVRACASSPGYAPPVVVLGSEADEILARWKPAKNITVVRNAAWQSGQISSLRAGLRWARRRSPFLIFPVDYPLITAGILSRLRWAYLYRFPGETIVVPAWGGRDGHPILVAPEMRREFLRATMARDVVHRKDRPERILRLPVRDAGIFRDFDSPRTYRLCVQLMGGRFRA